MLEYSGISTGARAKSDAGMLTKLKTSKIVALMLAMLLGTAGVVALAAPGQAATHEHIRVSFGQGNGTHQGLPVFNEGAKIPLNIEYDLIDSVTGAPSSIVEGESIQITLDGPISLPIGNIPVPDGNDSLKSLHWDGSVLTVTFADHFNPETTNGVLQMELDAVADNGSSREQLSWSFDGQSGTTNIIVRENGDNFWTPTNSRQKDGSGSPNFSSYISIVNGEVVIDPAITTVAIPYTVTIQTQGAVNGLVLTDTLPEGLVFSNATVSTVLYTWDADGMNRQGPTLGSVGGSSSVVAGKNVHTSYPLDVPANSRLVATYTTTIDPAHLEAIAATLNSQVDPDNGGYASFPFVNSIAFSDGFASDTGSQSLGVNVPGLPGPDLGNAFRKSVDVTQVSATPAADGTLPTAVPLTYTLSVNLSSWDGSNSKRVLDRNVVISDTVPAGASWDTQAADFITDQGLNLTQESGFSGTASAFADDAYVGKWALVGNQLLVNVGQDPATVGSIAIKANLESVGANNPWNIPSGYVAKYDTSNRATFAYNANSPENRDAVTAVVDPGDTSNGVKNDNIFNKSAAASGTQYVSAGAEVPVAYNFVVNESSYDRPQDGAVPLRGSTIVDVIDTNVFKFDSVDDITISNLETRYWGSPAFGISDLDIVKNGDRLEIRVKDEFLDRAYGAGGDTSRRLTFTLTLTTKPIVGKQTLQITNRAIVEGSSGDPLFWNEASSSASSFGNEAEVRKALYKEDEDMWTAALRAEVDSSGNLVKNEFVYRLTYVQHRNYGAVSSPIPAVVDRLPEGVEFLEFVRYENGQILPFDANDWRVKYNASTGETRVDLQSSANLEASHTKVDGRDVVTIRNPLGTNRSPGAESMVYFRVRVNDATEGSVVMNSIGRVSASLIPTNDYPITVSKVNADDTSVVIDDPNARFSVVTVDDDGAETVVVSGIFVEDGHLVQRNNAGDVVSVTVPNPGTYYIREDVAPTGYELSTERIRVVVDANGNSAPVTFYNEESDVPVGPTGSFRIAKYVSGITEDDFDADKTYQIRAEWEIDGQEFSQLFTLVPNVTQQGPALPVGTVVTFTELTAGRDIPGYDFDSVRVGTEILSSYEIAITDGGNPLAGVQNNYRVQVPDPDPLYAVGNYTWIDVNRDGLQTTGEPVLPGIEVSLYNIVNGQPVFVDSVFTDSRGLYFFDNLPAGDYRIDFEIPENLRDLYEFTTANTGTNDAIDSDAIVDPAATYRGSTVIFTLDENSPLTASDDYELDTIQASEGIDPTWDAGVVYRTGSVSIAKTVVGPTVDDETFDFDWVATAPTGVVLTTAQQSGRVTGVAGDGTATTLSVQFPVGTTVEFTEVSATRPSFAGYTFDSVEFAPASATSSEVGVSAAVNTTATVAVTAENTYEAIPPVLTYAIGDFTWVDVDRDGVQDAGEPVLVGVTVNLLNADGTPYLDGAGDPVTTTTDVNGRYIFDLLPAGDYRVEFVLTPAQQALYVFTEQNSDDSTAANGSDADTATGRTGVITLGASNTALTKTYSDQTVQASEGIDPTWDAGVVYRTGSVSIAKTVVGPTVDDETFDFDWVATAPTGVVLTSAQQSGRVTGVAGDGTATVLSVAFPVGTTVEFTELSATRPSFAGYTFDSVEFAPASATSSEVGVSAAVNTTATVAVTAENTYVRIPRVSVGDFVWVDSNNDGRQTPGEPGIPGVVLELVGPTGQPVTDVLGNPVTNQTTGRNGEYLFSNLPVLNPGESYTVRIVRNDPSTVAALSKYIPTTANVGDRVLDSDTWEARSQGLNADLDHDPTLDFGFVLKPITGGESEGGSGVPPTTPKPGDGLSSTGVDDTVWMFGGMALVLALAGFGLVIGGRRRTNA